MNRSALQQRVIVWRRRLALLPALTIALTLTMGPLGWATCPHHLGVFSTNTGHNADNNYFAILAQAPLCGDRANVITNKKPINHSAPDSHACQCGDLNCTAAKHGFMLPASVVVSTTWPERFGFWQLPAAAFTSRPEHFQPPAHAPPA